MQHLVENTTVLNLCEHCFLLHLLAYHSEVSYFTIFQNKYIFTSYLTFFASYITLNTYC